LACSTIKKKCLLILPRFVMINNQRSSPWAFMFSLKNMHVWKNKITRFNWLRVGRQSTYHDSFLVIMSYFWFEIANLSSDVSNTSHWSSKNNTYGKKELTRCRDCSIFMSPIEIKVDWKIMIYVNRERYKILFGIYSVNSMHLFFFFGEEWYIFSERVDH
jgi:hypothetical protein